MYRTTTLQYNEKINLKKTAKLNMCQNDLLLRYYVTRYSFQWYCIERKVDYNRKCLRKKRIIHGIQKNNKNIFKKIQKCLRDTHSGETPRRLVWVNLINVMRTNKQGSKSQH